MGPIDPAEARSAAEAVTTFFDRHQRALSCVTPAVLTGRAYVPASDPFTMGLGESRARLGRHSGFALTVRHGYRFAESAGGIPWRVTTTSYAYRLLDRDDRVVLAYHWHPIGSSPIAYPHLHVGGRTAPVDLSKAHLPTGFVTLPAVIRMTITEFGVEPLRADWRDVLKQADQALTA